MTRSTGCGSSAEQRLRRSERIRKRREFVEIQAAGGRIHTDDVVLLYRRRGEERRIGITVSRKVGNAVRRNRVKRLVREIWRRNKYSLPQGYDLVFVAKRSAAGARYARLEQQLLQAVRRLRW